MSRPAGQGGGGGEQGDGGGAGREGRAAGGWVGASWKEAGR